MRWLLTRRGLGARPRISYRVSEHELRGEIELKNPAEITLTMPGDIQSEIERCEYYNETLQEVTL